MQRVSTPRAVCFIAIVAASALAACSKTADAPPPAADAPPAAPVAEAPAPPAVKNVKEFMVGEYTALALRDGTLELPNDNKVFGVGRTPEEVAAVLGAAGQPTDNLHLTIEPLLVRAFDRVLLFDTGAGSTFGPTAGQLQASLAEAGIDAKSVTDIFISHTHGDHVGGLVNAQGALNFPNATVHLSKAEWKSLSENTGDWQTALAAAIKPKLNAFAPGSQIIKGTVKAVEIKGHTPGHSGYLLTSGPDSLLYVGDSMHHYVVSVQKPEWTNSFDGDDAVASKSRAALIADSAAKGQRIYAVHFPFPGIGKFEKQGDGFVWVAE
jgi:glyoxylase-like metal-dependent hydrolase (beta-lactamase superfamily II)